MLKQLKLYALLVNIYKQEKVPSFSSQRNLLYLYISLFACVFMYCGKDTNLHIQS